LTFFWDTSALIPLIVEQQPFTAQATRLAGDPGHRVVSFVADLEGRAAIERLRRERTITSARSLQSVRRAWSKLLDGFDSIRFDERILQHARELVERHPLRTLDALQLASCKALIGTFRQADLVLVTADTRLAAAASRELSAVRLLGA